MVAKKIAPLQLGGARPGAGRKTRRLRAQRRPPRRHEAARARNESAKADLNGLDLAIKRGEYVPRAEVQAATATALSALSQTLRSVPDNLERTLGLSPDIAQEVGRQIDAALDDMATRFEEPDGAGNRGGKWQRPRITSTWRWPRPPATCAGAATRCARRSASPWPRVRPNRW